MKMNKIANSLVETLNADFAENVYVVGDLHGCYDLLMQRLHEQQFNFDKDLLISVGDLVDRGKQNVECANLLLEPWFKAVRGNHEQFCIEGSIDSMMADIHARDNIGGEWLYQLSEAERQTIVHRFDQLPIVLELLYHDKKYGFVHADIDVNDWEVFKQEIKNSDYYNSDGSQSSMQVALWHQGRVLSQENDLNYRFIIGVDEVYLGHTVTKNIVQKQNCFFIDTGAVFSGELAIVRLDA